MEWTLLPLFALAVFVTVFLLVVLRVVLIQRPAELDALAALPLEEGTQVNVPRQASEVRP